MDLLGGRDGAAGSTHPGAADGGYRHSAGSAGIGIRERDFHAAWKRDRVVLAAVRGGILLQHHGGVLPGAVHPGVQLQHRSAERVLGIAEGIRRNERKVGVLPLHALYRHCLLQYWRGEQYLAAGAHTYSGTQVSHAVRGRKKGDVHGVCNRMCLIVFERKQRESYSSWK